MTKLHKDLEKSLKTGIDGPYISNNFMLCECRNIQQINEQYIDIKQKFDELINTSKYLDAMNLYRFDKMREFIDEYGHLADDETYSLMIKKLFLNSNPKAINHNILDSKRIKSHMLNSNNFHVNALRTNKVRLYRRHGHKWWSCTIHKCLPDQCYYDINDRSSVESVLVDGSCIVNVIETLREYVVTLKKNCNMVIDTDYRINKDTSYAHVYKTIINHVPLIPYNCGMLYGPWHWMKVEYNAMRLCDLNPAADRKVCRLFAILHDWWYWRTDNRSTHVLKSQRHQWKFLANLSDEQFDKLVFAIDNVNIDIDTDDQTIGTCLDADALDDMRLGHFLNINALHTDVAKLHAFEIW